MAVGRFNKINFGAGLEVLDEGGGVITVSGGGGPPGPAGPAGPAGPTGPAGTLPADVVIPAASFMIRNRFLSGDTQPAFRLLGDGKHEWGPGGTTAPDTMLYRQSPGTLRTEGTLDIVKSGGAALRVYAAASDPTAAARLTTVSLDFGPGASSGAFDTTLWRLAANVLGTPGYFRVSEEIQSETGKTSQIALSDSAGRPIIYFGSAYDTYLYRSAAAVLRTEGAFSVGGQIRADSVVAGAVGGAQANKLPIYNAAGTLLGYAPLYAT